MQYQTNNNAQQSKQQERFAPGYYQLKAKTKERTGFDGNPNRGILITDGVNEQWITIPASNEVCRMTLGSKVYYHGHGQRPSLTFRQEQQNDQYFDNGGVRMNQPQADYYNRIAEPPQQSVYEQINNGMYPQNQQNEFDYNPISNQQNGGQNGQQRITGDINDTLLESQCVLLSNAINLMSSLSPQLSEESIVKLAISASIAYQHKIKDMPF